MIRRCERGQRFTLAFCGCLALLLPSLLLLSACNQAPPDTRAADEAAVRDTDAQWSKTAATKDVDATVAFYADDASLLPPNSPIVTGKPNIRAVWAELLAPGTALSWQANKVEVARSGDLAYLTGTYEMTMKDAQGNPVTDKGKMVEVFRKQPDGKWKTVADIFNSDLPAVPAAAPEVKK